MLTRGCITLTFDDGYEHIHQNIVPLLRRFHIPAVFAIPLTDDKIAARIDYPLRPWQKWLSLQQQGHEIAAHSINHSDLTTLTPEHLVRELQEPYSQLKAHTVVYPGGAHNDTVVNEAKKYYAAGRTVKKGFETLPPKNAMRLTTFNFTRDNFSVMKANTLALYAWATNSWLIETYHIISNNSSNHYSIPLTDFTRHLQFISRLPIAKKTIQQALS